MLWFVVLGYSAKFKRNENFFKILFIAILIRFAIFLMREIIFKITLSYNINFFFLQYNFHVTISFWFI